MSDSWKGVLVYAECISGKVHPVTYELLSKARELVNRLGGNVKALLLSSEPSNLPKDLVIRGADEVYAYVVPKEDELNILLHARITTQLVKEVKPKLVLFGATPWGRSLAPRVAASLRTGLTADCLDLRVDDEGNIIQVRPAFTGNIIAYIKTVTLPVMATVRYKAFSEAKANPLHRGRVFLRRAEASLKEREMIRVVGKVRDKEIDITNAKVVVAGGRGVKRKEDLKMLENLAKLLGGVVGVSRPLVDMGWVGKDRQVGFSGNIVKPKVYIACGISGSPQHLAGMRDSGRIISINIDPSAPIRKFSDLFIIGDLYEVIPKLIAEIRRVKKVSTSSY